MKDVRLEGKKVYLRYISYDDTDTIVRWRNQENVRKYFLFRDEFTTQIHESWIKNHIETGDVDQFIVCMKDTDRPVGSTYLRDIDHDNSKAEYGVFIGEEEVRGQGIGKEILELTCRYAFDVLKLHKVYARVIEGNDASLYCFLHCGFEQEGLLRDTRKIDGEYLNTYIVSRLNDNE